jgi:hypothetical protein
MKRRRSTHAPLDATVPQKEVTATADVTPDRWAKGWNAVAVLEGPSRRIVRECVEGDFRSTSTWAEHGDVPEVFSFADRVDPHRLEVLGLFFDMDDAVRLSEPEKRWRRRWWKTPKPPPQPRPNRSP